MRQNSAIPALHAKYTPSVLTEFNSKSPDLAQEEITYGGRKMR